MNDVLSIILAIIVIAIVGVIMIETVDLKNNPYYGSEIFHKDKTGVILSRDIWNPYVYNVRMECYTIIKIHEKEIEKYNPDLAR